MTGFFILFSCCLFLAGVAFASSNSSNEDSREAELGKEIIKQVEGRWSRITDPVLTARLEVIFSRFRPFLTRNLDYQVRLIDDKEVNAFAIPGGTVYITKGMLDFVQSDAELAAVLSHELEHVEHKHILIQSARNEKLSLVSLAVALASRGEGSAILLSSIAQIAIMNSYSRDLEKQADLEGIKLLERAGYPPVAMLTMLEGLKEDELKHPYFDPGIFQDHPDINERIGYITAYMKEHHLPIQRKLSLQVLRTSVIEKPTELTLAIDGVPVWNAPKEIETKSFFEKVKKILDEHLQVELPPYEVRLEGNPGSRQLRLGGILLAKEDGLPSSQMDPLPVVRDRLVSVMDKARKIHPLADYF